MAGEEDGSQFIGIDDAAVGDGTTDGTTRPLSMGLENRIDGNVRYLQERGSQVSRPWYTSWRAELETRPYVSVGWSYICLVPWELTPGVDQITCKLQCEIGLNGTTTASLDVALELRDVEGRVKRTTQTEGPTSGVEVVTLTLDLSDVTIERGAGGLGIMIRSQARDEGSTVTVNSANVANGHTFAGSAVNGWGISYADSSTADNEISETTSVARVKLIHKSDTSDFVDNGHISGIGANQIGGDVTIFEETYIEPISATFDVRYASDSDGGQYAAKDPRSMQAQEPVKGREVSGHGQSLDAIFTRPKCRALGPHGQSEGQSWPTDYRRQWTWLNVSDEADTELDRQSFHLRHSGSRVRCIAYIAGLYQLENAQVEDVEDTGAVIQDREGYIQDWRASGTLDLDVEIEQMNPDTSPTSWSDATVIDSVTRSVEDFSLFKVTPADHYPLAQQAFWSRHPEGPTMETPDNGSDEFHFPYHEGQLYPDDLDLLPVTGISVDVSADTVGDRASPIRCNLDFGGFSEGPFTDDVIRGGTFTYFLVCVGTAWWELPQL